MYCTDCTVEELGISVQDSNREELNRAGWILCRSEKHFGPRVKNLTSALLRQYCKQVSFLPEERSRSRADFHVLAHGS